MTDGPMPDPAKQLSTGPPQSGATSIWLGYCLSIIGVIAAIAAMVSIRSRAPSVQTVAPNPRDVSPITESSGSLGVLAVKSQPDGMPSGATTLDAVESALSHVPTSADPGTTVLAAAVARPPSHPPRNARDLVMLRKYHDQTVWSDEVKAQQYEQTFVKLWDSLIWQDDKYQVLRDFAFDKLILGRELSEQQIDWGIRIATVIGPERVLDSQGWAKLLGQFQDRDFRIIETEWHHQRFQPGSKGQPASSFVSMRLHVEHPPTSRRLIIKGNLKIDWATAPTRVPSKTDPSRTTLVVARPATIDATDLTIIYRQGEPAFRQQSVYAFEQDESGRKPQFTTHPIILHDLDQDGLPELIVGGYNRVYWNRGNWQFEPSPLCDQPADRTTGGIFGDFTGDGVTDYLCVVKGGFPRLYEGVPGGRFPSESRVLKIADQPLPFPIGVTAGDIDGDGDLDVFIGQQKPGYQNGDIPTPYYDANDSFPSYLLVNDGRGQFHDGTAAAGLGRKRQRRNFSASFVDLDEDDDLDLVLTSDFAGTDLFFNDGQGLFTDVTDQLQPGGHAFGMSHTFGDYNLDGRLDFLQVGMSSTTARRLEQMRLGREEFPDINQARMQMGYGNRMFLRQGDGFLQSPFNASVARTGWSWGSTTLDFDCDGDQDVYVVNGQTSGKTTQDYCTRFWCHDVYYKRGQRPDVAIRELFSNMAPLFSGSGISWNGYEHNALLMNQAGKDFINIGFLMGASFEYDSRSALSGDLDGDGRVDLIVEQRDLRNGKSKLHIVRNQWSSPNHWIGVHLGQRPGVSPLGARITVQLADGHTLLQHNLSGHSVWAQHANTVHFGLGATGHVDRIEVRWPDASVSTLDHPAVDQYHRVTPSLGPNPATATPATARTRPTSPQNQRS